MHVDTVHVPKTEHYGMLLHLIVLTIDVTLFQYVKKAQSSRLNLVTLEA